MDCDRSYVTSCRFQFARMNTFTLGIQTGEKFRIGFDYHAHGRLYSTFQSPVAVPQNERIPSPTTRCIPSEQSHHRPERVAHAQPADCHWDLGSIVLSLLWFTVMRGCS